MNLNKIYVWNYQIRWNITWTWKCLTTSRWGFHFQSGVFYLFLFNTLVCQSTSCLLLSPRHRRRAEVMEFKNQANPTHKVHLEVETCCSWSWLKFTFLAVLCCMVLSPAGKFLTTNPAWKYIVFDLFLVTFACPLTIASWFMTFSCIWSIGSNWKHNDQMGCYVLDTRWLCCKISFEWLFVYVDLLTNQIF